ncbi:GAF domain-containing protein [Arthrobacter sp. NamB2]|uniref:GAF domain-containing protein n=1 Tax=Arthrobacter sp. NamB2 TaxID=2576035 RepID=UPI0010C94BD7|nr:GAF domain-containing protein [Arthrobacter sp. NamB2]TKV29076.1 GAF domain-containing protein [Arthrobacter sp. NamB2]
MDELGLRDRIAGTMRQADLSLAEVWIEYFAIGGSLSELEIDAYLRGQAELPVLEGELLAEGVRSAADDLEAISDPATADPSCDQPPSEIVRQLGAAGAVLLDATTAERERLWSLEQLALVGTPPEHRFDRITRRAAERYDCEVATLAFIGDDRQFIKSVVGEAHQGLERAKAFCNATIRSAGPLVLTDASQDDRFRSNPFVAGEPYIRFYAGYPLRGPGGWTVGTLCVMSTSPRTFGDTDLRDLESLAQEMQHEVYPGWKAWSLLP